MAVKSLKLIGGVALGAFVLIGGLSLVPINRTNPVVTYQMAWDSPQTKALWDRACKDCHSNETVWPAWSYIAPGNFLIANHVGDGRRKLNVSVLPTRGTFAGSINDAVQDINRGSMPDPLYVPLHPDSKLTTEEKTQLIAGIRSTFSTAK